MTDLRLTDLSQFRDTQAVARYRMMIEELGLPPDQALEAAARGTRDACRTPMQWADAPNAGFSPPGVTTWLPVNPNYAEGVNVAAQEHDPASLLQFYRRLLSLRRATPALIAGAYAPQQPEATDYLLFTRSTPDQTVLVALNFSAQAQTVALGEGMQAAQVLFSSVGRQAASDNHGQLVLAPFEVYIAEVARQQVLAEQGAASGER